MVRKRTPLRFDELEPRGRGAVIRTREEIEAEDRILASQLSGKPETRSASNPDSRVSGFPAGGSDVVNRAQYEKVTYRISPDAVEAIDEIKRIMRRHHGVKVTREEIAEVAILHALKECQDNQKDGIVVSWLSGKPENDRAS